MKTIGYYLPWPGSFSKEPDPWAIERSIALVSRQEAYEEINILKEQLEKTGSELKFILGEYQREIYSKPQYGQVSGICNSGVVAVDHGGVAAGGASPLNKNLRDEIAIAAMQSILNSSLMPQFKPDTVADTAYKIADAMIKSRKSDAKD